MDATTLIFAALSFSVFALTIVGCMVMVGSKRMKRDLEEANEVKPSPCFCDKHPETLTSFCRVPTETLDNQLAKPSDKFPRRW